MDIVLIIIACLAIIVAYVVWCRRRDGRAHREHQAVMMAMSPGLRIRQLTTVRTNPTRTRKFASGSQPLPPVSLLGATSSYFAHVPTDYGTTTAASPCAEAPAIDTGHHVSHHDTCSTADTSCGEFDGVNHHGH